VACCSRRSAGPPSCAAADPLQPSVAAERLQHLGRRRLRRAVATLRAHPTLGVPYAFGFIDRFTAGFFGIASWIPKSMLLAARQRRLELREELDSRLQDSAAAEP